ncbi:Hypothetical predicted protein [Scomber scombrus]|uniref:Uncharacterized protein n=1 Tax=Scomber scombrus TaxID=13677 RepID=A0AAV1PD68_SCOSC
MPAIHAVSLNPTAVLRLIMDIRHRDACNPCRLLTPITALRSNGNLGHQDARNPCCLLTPITALCLDQNIGTRMPTTPAVPSLHPHHFNSARMFDVSDPAVYSIQPWLLA